MITKCEIWKPIIGYEDKYEISNLGNVRSRDIEVDQRHYSGVMARHVYRGQEIKKHPQRNGYLTVDLHRHGRPKRFLVHRLVGFHFLNKEQGKDYINHLDGNRANNNADNLVWCTQSENVQYAYDLGSKIPPHKKRIGQYDLDGRLIRTWNSIAEAGRGLNIQSPNIGKVCSGIRRKAGGYYWRYIQDNT